MCIRMILKIRKNRPNWAVFIWLRGMDLNQRPPGYEPDELPTALPRDVVFRRAKRILSDRETKVNPAKKIYDDTQIVISCLPCLFLCFWIKFTRKDSFFLRESLAKSRGICNNRKGISVYPNAQRLLHFLFAATFKKEGYQSAWLAVQQCGDLL